MKKKLIMFSLIFVCLFSVFALAGCVNNNDNDAPPALTGTEATFKDFTKVDDTTYSIKVANVTETFNFSNSVSVANNSKWQLTADIYGIVDIPSKIGTLDVGDNTYYVLVTDNEENVKMYTLNIRRRVFYTVAFNTVGGTTVDSIQVEEDSFLPNNISTPIKEDYIFYKWDYNLESPMTKNTTLTAIYNLKQYNINYALNGGTNNSLNPSNFTINDYPLVLNEPIKQDYTFIGWYDNSEFTGDKITSINDIHRDITLYAKWKYDYLTHTISAENDGFIDRMITEVANTPITYNSSKNCYTINATITFNPNACPELVSVKDWDINIVSTFKISIKRTKDSSIVSGPTNTISKAYGTISSANSTYQITLSLEIAQSEIQQMVGTDYTIEKVALDYLSVECVYSGSIIYKPTDQ
ncbi:MAG: InlB B-repeat-containing protein [Christensenellales bacterium]